MINDKPKSEFAIYGLMITSLYALGFSASRLYLVFPMMFVIALHSVLSGKIQINMTFKRWLILGIPFAIASREWPAEGAYMNISNAFNLGFYVSLYVEAVAIVILYSKPNIKRVTQLLSASGISLTIAGIEMSKKDFYTPLIIYCLFLLLQLRTTLIPAKPFRGDLKRNMIIGMVTAFNCAAGLTIVLLLFANNNYGSLNRWFIHSMRVKSSPGFSKKASIGNISSRRDGAQEGVIALRAFQKEAPGYLRGKVFWTYGDAKWGAPDKGHAYVPQKREGSLSKAGLVTLPERRKPEDWEEPTGIIYPAREYRAHFFTPLQTDAIETVSTPTNVNSGSIFASARHATSMGYTYFLGKFPVEESPVHLKKNAAVTPEMRQKLLRKYRTVPLSKKMHSALQTVLERISWRKNMSHDELKLRLMNYFSIRYEYRIGIQFRDQKNPLVEFLDNDIHKHGHCELFASAGALLMRKAGIPTRYVTGFVCEEKNDYGDMWIARNRHAHAWVEYYTEGKGWRTAEFTPASGQPDTTPKKGGLWDYLVGQLKRFISFYLREGISGMMTIVLSYVGFIGEWFVEKWWRMAMCVLLPAIYYIGRYVSRWTKEKKRKPRVFPARIEDARKQFFRLERKLKKLGLQRSDEETPQEYAQRLSEAEFPDKENTLEFIRRFSELRYSTDASESC